MTSILLPSSAARWNDLRLRVASALVLAPLALICIWAGGVAFAALIIVATFGCLFEWQQMVRAGRGTLSNLGMLGNLLPGSVYIVLAAVGLAWLRFDPLAGRANLLFLLILVWASDIGAYASGRAIGGPRLAPHISPGKTISGAVGGLVAAVLVGIIAAGLWPGAFLRAGIVAGMLGMVAQAGDLLESFAKRHFGVKDSGRLIPGHGGLLDRLDALLAVALAASLLALWEGRGVVLWQ